MKTLMAESQPQPAPAPMRTETLLELRGLEVEYGYGELRTRAVDGIDLAIRPGEILGLAGESGCGKTTVAGAVMQILRPPGHVVGGSILFRGEDLVGRKEKELRKFRWRKAANVPSTVGVPPEIAAPPGVRPPQAGPGQGRPRESFNAYSAKRIAIVR